MDYSGLPLPKPTPRVVTKATKTKRIEDHRKTVKAAVFARDGSRCRVCGGPATEMHELKFRSLLGQRSLENSIAVCAFTGRNCHRYLQVHAIEVEGSDANKRLIFRWNKAMVKEPPFKIRSKRRSQQ